MKPVEHFDILGNPNRIERQVACPDCHERAIAFEDGSVMCVIENRSFAPQVEDGELFELRRAFDARNGITPSDRQTIPARLRQAVAIAKEDRE